MVRHHNEHLVVEVFVHQGFARIHELLVGDHIFRKVGKVLNGFGVVVPKLVLVVETPLSVMMRSRNVKRSGEHLFKFFQ